MISGYPAYVAADSLWLDTIPIHWRMGRLDHVARAWPSNVDKHSVAGEPPVRLCNYTDVYKNASIVDSMEFMAATASPEQIERFRIAIGDTLLTKDSETADDIGVPAYVEYEAQDLICGYHLSIVRPISGAVEPKFLYWALAAAPTAGQWAVLASGVTRVGIRAGDLAKAALALPPLNEQRAIADYLDRETARIDTLIEVQQALVQMLRERRAATVAEALDGYEMTRLRRLVDAERPMTYGILQCGEPVDGGVPYIGPSDITGEGASPERDALRTTTHEIASAYQRSVLTGGDVVVSIGPAYGKVAVVANDLTGANLTQDTVRVALRPDMVDTRFVVWALLSRQTSEYWDYQIMGATFRRLNLGTLARTPIPLPPIDVQRSIAAYLDEQTAKIDLLIAESEQFVELARERRAALITAVVTGQVDVREVA